MNDSNVQRDPSMDDILSSIRRIIQEDSGRAAGATEAPRAAPPRSGASGPAPSPGVAAGGASRPNGKPSRQDDVLLLTDLVEEPDAGATRAPAPPVPPMASSPISSAMDRLARAVEEARPPVTPVEPVPAAAGGRTLEEVVQDMLRPLLREWLDKNLPPLVERIVEREVQRLTRR
jgi:uncharacterized protein